MADTPEAPAPTPGESEAIPTSNTPDAPQSPDTPQAPQSPDMHGFTSEQLADIDKFFKANGGFEAIKSKISNPESFQKPTEAPQTAPEPQNDNQPTSQPNPPVEQTQQPLPKGARTNEDLMAEYYFRTLSEKPEYAAISEDIRRGKVLKEMDNLGINYKYPNGAWNDERINDYLKLKAQTVPAKPTEATPDASAAPTVDYIEVGDQIASLDQAYQVIMQPNHPATSKAEEYIKNHFNSNSEKK